jgi:hypothetical protein
VGLVTLFGLVQAHKSNVKILIEPTPREKEKDGCYTSWVLGDRTPAEHLNRMLSNTLVVLGSLQTLN